jgi:hypothetical protein
MFHICVGLNGCEFVSCLVTPNYICYGESICVGVTGMKMAGVGSFYFFFPNMQSLVIVSCFDPWLSFAGVIN